MGTERTQRIFLYRNCPVCKEWTRHRLETGTRTPICRNIHDEVDSDVSDSQPVVSPDVASPGQG